jgi:MYXO-CTERM domain-containing protein
MRHLTIPVLFAATTSFAFASPSYQSIGAFGGYATALAGYGTGNSYFYGDNLEADRTEVNRHDANWNFFTTGSASASANWVDPTVTAADGIATGSMGVFHLDGSATGYNSTFRYGGGSGGWSDTWNINKSGLTGTKGTLNFSMQVDGSLSANGVTGAAEAGLEVYDNGNHGLSYTYQVITVQGPPQETISADPTFSVSFTYGTPFTLGLFMQADGESRAEGGQMALSSGSSDFSDTISWNGITSVLDASNNPLTDYSLTTASGIDWRGAATPEPAPFVALGVGVLALIRRRRSLSK